MNLVLLTSQRYFEFKGIQNKNIKMYNSMKQTNYSSIPHQ